MPNDDLGLLITLNICLTLMVLLAAVGLTWMIMRQNLWSQEIAERIDLRLRRQYADIDRELQEIIRNAWGKRFLTSLLR
ncbi:MAG: hypothetical protein FJZ47_00215 [Candidatus Tectomicrobia bacterium]|uniref:Uncharacterized protein n=1 Tax=Tectimicrobiota bacterium TaxID=2528274 RepID=A0A937VX78_UNCTE|nr:hypothetical protein [Candidatus Tectomicrobia bacterium]